MADRADDPDLRQGWDLAEADECQRTQASRLFDERLKLERARQADLDDKEFDAAIKRANESANSAR